MKLNYILLGVILLAILCINNKEGFSVPGGAKDIDFCTSECKKQGYCCNNPNIGSNQFLSCSQACLIGRKLQSSQKCNNECNVQSSRRGCSWNSPSNVGTFSMCSTCNDLTNDPKCHWGVSGIGSCQAGCKIGGGGGGGNLQAPTPSKPIIAKGGEQQGVYNCGGGWFSKITSNRVNAETICEQNGFGKTIDKYGGNSGRQCSQINNRAGGNLTSLGYTVSWHCSGHPEPSPPSHISPGGKKSSPKIAPPDPQTDYVPTAVGQVENKTYGGPSTEDNNACIKLGLGGMPCGNVEGQGAGRCIRTKQSCMELNGDGSNPNLCGTCMKRKPENNGGPKELEGGKKLVLPPCTWREWGDWTACNKSCGGGEQYRYRQNNGYCYSGDNIINWDSQKQPCNTQQCGRGPVGPAGLKGIRGPRGPVGDIGPHGKSGGVAGIKGISGKVGGKGAVGPRGSIGAKGPMGFRGQQGKVVSKSQVNNQVLTQIYDKLLRLGGNEELENFSLRPYNNSNYN